MEILYQTSGDESGEHGHNNGSIDPPIQVDTEIANLALAYTIAPALVVRYRSFLAWIRDKEPRRALEQEPFYEP